MGLMQRVRDLFKAQASEDEHPEQVLHAYIEASSEKLRELSVAVNRARSEWLSFQEKIDRGEAETVVCRTRAEEAASQGNAEEARRWLDQAYTETRRCEKLKPSAERLKQSADQLKESLDLLTGKLQTAKDMREQLRIRSRGAASERDAQQYMNSHSTDAMDRLQQETFLAEAKAELERTRPY